MRIINNFLDENDSDDLEHYLSSNEFPWYLISNCVTDLGSDISSKFVNPPVFRHTFINNGKVNSQHVQVLDKLLHKIADVFNTGVLYQKVNVNCLTVNTGIIGELVLPHVDEIYADDVYKTHDTYTGIYYVSDCDADTVLYNEKHTSNIDFKTIQYTEKQRILNVKNNFVFWDSRVYHSAPASANKTRLVINVNFCIKK